MNEKIAVIKESRQGTLESHKKYALYLCERLHELSQNTDPQLDNSENNKDYQAFKALQLAGSFVRSLAGWAINHEIGLAYNKLQYVPKQPSQTEDHEEYLKKKEAVDSHQHEYIGCQYHEYGEGGSALNDLALRQLLRNLIYPNAFGLPDIIRQDYLKSLDASKIHDVQGFLKIPTSGHMRNVAEAKALKMKAIGFVYFLKESGKTLTVARGDVGDAYGCSDGETVRGWEKVIKKSEPLEFEREKVFARNAYINLDHAKKRNSDEDIRIFESMYGSQTLIDTGNKYKCLDFSGKKISQPTDHG